MEMPNDKVRICRNTDYIVDSSHIIRKSQIPIAYKYAEAKRQRKRVPLIDTRLNYVQQDLILTSEWCPQPVILYTHTEDCNPSVRVHDFTQQLPKNKKQKSILPTTNYFSTDEAQIQYLASNPVCFLVCGKPGLNEEKVAKELAKYWNCCYLDPMTAITQEIESKSRTGRFIEYNLRSGRAIGGDVIMNVIKQLVNSSSSRHQGFVLSGVPIIPNDLFDVDEPLASEAAVYVAEKILDNLLTTITKKQTGPSETNDLEEASYYSSEDEIPFNELGSRVSNTTFRGKSQKFDLYLSLKNQLNEVLNYFQPPFIIIYLKCSANEILMHRDKLRHDIDANQQFNLADEYIERVLNPDQMWHSKRLAKEVRHFGRNVRDEIEHYAKYVQPILDQFILNHDQQYVITIDARLPLAEMNEAIRLRLNTLPLQRVVTVEKFRDVIKPQEEEGDEEEQTKESEISDTGKVIKIQYDFTDKTCEDVFNDFQNICTIGPRYRWQLSHWTYNCPVALRHGRIATGKPTNAVRFMNHIYFLENEQAMCLFTRNPRPYLLPPNPQCPGKIYLFGIEHCGARDVAICLSYVYNLGVVDITQIFSDIRQAKIQEAIEAYRLNLIEEYYEEMYAKELQKWEDLSMEIDEKRKQWLETILKLYASYEYNENELMQRTVLQAVQLENPFRDYSPQTIQGSETAVDRASILSVTQIEEQLRSMNVPIDTVFITEALENPGILFKYIPQQYERIAKPVKQQNMELNPNVLHRIDNLTQIFHNELIQENFTVTEDEALPVIVDAIHKVENQKAEQTKNYVKQSGWIIVNAKTSALVEHLYEAGIIPNIVLYLYDDDVDNRFLIRKYSRQKFMDYHLMKTFLELNGFELAAERCHTIVHDMTTSNDILAREYAKDVVNQILRSERFKYADKLKSINGETPWIEQEVSRNKSGPGLLGIGGEGTASINSSSDVSNNLFRLIEDFDNEWDLLSLFFAKLNIRPIHIKFARDIEDLMLDTIRVVNSLFRKTAKDFDEHERIHELAEHDFSKETEEEEELEDETNNLETLNRNFGDTLEYCPIALLKHNVLWKGKNEFGAMYENKLYFFSNEHAKEQFIWNPYQFVPFRFPKQYLPPVRICIVGPIASGKTTIGQMLAKEFGLIYVNFLDIIKIHCLPNFLKVGRKNQDVYITDKVALDEYSPNEADEQLFQSFVSYFEGKSALPTKYLNRVLPRLWQHEPYSACGILLDGYPFSASDFEYMTNSYLIPDIVISLRTRLSTTIQRSLDELLEEWKRQKNKIIQQKKDQLDIELNQWKMERQRLYDQLLEERINDRIEEILKSVPADSTASTDVEIESGVDSNAVTIEEATMEAKRFEEEDKNTVLEQVDLELQKPMMEDDLETQEEAELRLIQFIEDSYADECLLVQPFEQICKENSIPFMEVNANRQPEKILLELLYKLNALKMRNESFLEKTFPLSLLEANRLLNFGYYFLSNYGYSCPVQMYNDQNPIQLYNTKVVQMKVYPIIHRQYIYYVNDSKSLQLFQANPLKYTQRVKNYPSMIFRVAIIGPPKCGKSTLADRYGQEFGFQIVTRGEAIRYVLQTLPYTLLACKLDNQLRRGEVLDHVLVMEAVEVFCSRSAAIGQGIVFDGFPVFTEEMELLFNAGRYLVKACTKIGCFRPKYPKLACALSGLIYFGLYLKVNNPKTSVDEFNLYKKYLDRYEEICNRLKLWIRWSKQFRNPYLKCDLICSDQLKILKSCTDDGQILTPDEWQIPSEEMSKHDGTSSEDLGEDSNDSLLQMLINETHLSSEITFFTPYKVPAFLTVVDIAGLVKGASEGQGLGNAFLSEISACDAIFHLCRAFENEDVIHVEGDVNPIRDLEIIADELRFKDIEKLNKELEKLEKTYIRGNDKKLKPEFDTLQKVKTIIVDEQAQIRFSDWNAVEIEVLNKHLFLTSKPGIYLVNLSENDYIRKKNKWLIKIKEWVDKHDPGAVIIPFSGALELKLVDMPDDEMKAYLEANKTTSALDKIVVTGYKALQLEYFFTCGPDEVKAWTILKGTKAPGAAGRIHTHFEKGFIMAEVMKYSDFKQEGSESAVKAAGKYRQQGRNYVVEDGDIIYFKANTGAGLTKEAKKK